MAQSIPLVEFGLDPLTALTFLLLSSGQRDCKAIDNLSRISLVANRVRRLATRGARALGATHIAADRKQLRLERHTYKRHGSPWRAAPESDIAYATAGPYPSRNPPAMARVRAYRPTGCGYNPKRGRPGTGRRASVGPAGGRASSRGAGGGSGSSGSSSRRPTGQQRARSHQHPRRGC